LAENTSKIHIASNAIVLLGGSPFSSFTEDSAEARISASLYESSYLSLLTNHRWRFATKHARLARLSEKPIMDYEYMFQLPSDIEYLIKASVSNYTIHESRLYANATDINIGYIFRVKEDTLPSYFVKTLEFFLAAQFAVPLTGDMDKGKYYSALYGDALKKAKFADSTQQPNISFQHNPYVDVRA